MILYWITYELVPPPELHLLIGPVATLFSGLLSVWPSANDWLKVCNVECENYHGQSFTGNSAMTLLRNVDKLQSMCPIEALKYVRTYVLFVLSRMWLLLVLATISNRTTKKLWNRFAKLTWICPFQSHLKSTRSSITSSSFVRKGAVDWVHIVNRHLSQFIMTSIVSGYTLSFRLPMSIMVDLCWELCEYIIVAMSSFFCELLCTDFVIVLHTCTITMLTAWVRVSFCILS